MNDEQAERFITELIETRRVFNDAMETFKGATNSIRWTRINTTVQYVLLVAVLFLYTFGAAYYINDKHASCVRGNDLRVSIGDSLDANATAIGVALTVVTEAPQEKFEQYLEVYNRQPKPPALELRDC